MTSTTNPAGLNNPVAIANGGSVHTTAASAMDALSPLTTKGDVIGYTGSTNQRLAVGANATALICDSTNAVGYSWGTPPSVTSVGLSSTTLTVTGSPVTTSGNMTIDLPASVAGNNMLLNASMELMLRYASQNTGTTSTLSASSTTYTLDRWQCKTGASSAVSVQQIAGATSGSWVARIQRNNLNTNTNTIYFAQSCTRDMCLGAAGNKVTLSFWAKSGAGFSAASSNLTVTGYSGTGSSDISGIAGAFTGSSSVISSTATLTATLTKFTFTSSTLGSTVTQLCAEVSYAPVGTANSTDFFDITDVQLEISPQFTQFNRKTEVQVYTECSRFYFKSFLSNVAPAANTSGGQFAWTASQAATLSDPSHTFTFPTTMRVAPTMTLFNPSAAGAQARDITAAASCTSTTSIATAQGVAFTCTGAAGTAAGNQIYLCFTADAEIT